MISDFNFDPSRRRLEPSLVRTSMTVQDIGKDVYVSTLPLPQPFSLEGTDGSNKIRCADIRSYSPCGRIDINALRALGHCVVVSRGGERLPTICSTPFKEEGEGVYG